MDLDWNLTPREAADQQRALAGRVLVQNDFGSIRWVAGVDVGFEQAKTVSRAAAVILSFPEMQPVESARARRPVTFPYVPGLLAYRELPAVLDALAQIDHMPDLILVDGHGLAHPRRFGIASHLGVLLNCPTIGVAKTVLVGRAEMPEDKVGAWTPLVDKSETIGAALRTRVGVSPIHVSIGNRIDLGAAIDFVLRCCKGYRLPEPTRFAHRAASGEEILLVGV